MPRRQYRAYVSGTLYTLGVLLVGIPWVLAQLGFYWLRKVIFGVPIQGDWGECGQCEAWRKGPNTWN